MAYRVTLQTNNFVQHQLPARTSYTKAREDFSKVLREEFSVDPHEDSLVPTGFVKQRLPNALLYYAAQDRNPGRFKAVYLEEV